MFRLYYKLAILSQMFVQKLKNILKLISIINPRMDYLFQDPDYQVPEELLESSSSQDFQQTDQYEQFFSQDKRPIPVELPVIQPIELPVGLPEKQNSQSQTKTQKTKIIKKDKKTRSPQTKQKKLNQNRPHLNQERRSKLPSQKEPQQQTDAHKNILNPAQRFFLKQLEKKIPSLQIQLSTQNKAKYQEVKNEKAKIKNIDTLFKIKQFQPIWEEYFKNGKMYTDLEESRVIHKNKEIFMKVLWVFEVSFERREFKGIRCLIEEIRKKLANMFENIQQ